MSEKKELTSLSDELIEHGTIGEFFENLNKTGKFVINNMDVDKRQNLFDRSIRRGWLSTAKYLVMNHLVKITDSDLELACKCGNENIAIMLIENGARIKDLKIAMDCNMKKVLEKMLKNGATISLDKVEYRPHFAGVSNHEIQLYYYNQLGKQMESLETFDVIIDAEKNNEKGKVLTGKEVTIRDNLLEVLRISLEYICIAESKEDKKGKNDNINRARKIIEYAKKYLGEIEYKNFLTYALIQVCFLEISSLVSELINSGARLNYSGNIWIFKNRKLYNGLDRCYVPDGEYKLFTPLEAACYKRNRTIIALLISESMNENLPVISDKAIITAYNVEEEKAEEEKAEEEKAEEEKAEEEKAMKWSGDQKEKIIELLVGDSAEKKQKIISEILEEAKEEITEVEEEKAEVKEETKVEEEKAEVEEEITITEETVIGEWSTLAKNPSNKEIIKNLLFYACACKATTIIEVFQNIIKNPETPDKKEYIEIMFQAFMKACDEVNDEEIAIKIIEGTPEIVELIKNADDSYIKTLENNFYCGWTRLLMAIKSHTEGKSVLTRIWKFMRYSYCDYDYDTSYNEFYQNVLRIKIRNESLKLINACNEEDIEMVKALLEADETYGKANVNIDYCEDDIGKEIDIVSPLIRACEKENIELVKLLLDNGADIDISTKKGNPLIVACEKENIELVNLLLDRGANVNLVTDKGSPLTIACEKENIKLVNLLLDRGADVNLVTKKGSPLTITCEKENTELVDVLLANGADVDKDFDGYVPLIIAIVKQNLDLVKKLIQNGANINIQTNNGTPLVVAVATGNIEIVNYLIEMGAYVNLQAEKKGPLNMAITKENIEMLNLLIEKGAIIEDEDRIASCKNRKLDIIQLLLKMGVKYTKEDIKVASKSMKSDVLAFLLGHIYSSKNEKPIVINEARNDRY